MNTNQRLALIAIAAGVLALAACGPPNYIQPSYLSAGQASLGPDREIGFLNVTVKRGEEDVSEQVFSELAAQLANNQYYTLVDYRGNGLQLVKNPLGQRIVFRRGGSLKSGNDIDGADASMGVFVESARYTEQRVTSQELEVVGKNDDGTNKVATKDVERLDQRADVALRFYVAGKKNYNWLDEMDQIEVNWVWNGEYAYQGDVNAPKPKNEVLREAVSQAVAQFVDSINPKWIKPKLAFVGKNDEELGPIVTKMQNEEFAAAEADLQALLAEKPGSKEVLYDLLVAQIAQESWDAALTTADELQNALKSGGVVPGNAHEAISMVHTLSVTRELFEGQEVFRL